MSMHILTLRFSMSITSGRVLTASTVWLHHATVCKLQAGFRVPRTRLHVPSSAPTDQGALTIYPATDAKPRFGIAKQIELERLFPIRDRVSDYLYFYSEFRKDKLSFPFTVVAKLPFRFTGFGAWHPEQAAEPHHLVTQCHGFSLGRRTQRGPSRMGAAMERRPRRVQSVER